MPPRSPARRTATPRKASALGRRASHAALAPAPAARSGSHRPNAPPQRSKGPHRTPGRLALGPEAVVGSRLVCAAPSDGSSPRSTRLCHLLLNVWPIQFPALPRACATSAPPGRFSSGRDHHPQPGRGNLLLEAPGRRATALTRGGCKKALKPVLELQHSPRRGSQKHRPTMCICSGEEGGRKRSPSLLRCAGTLRVHLRAGGAGWWGRLDLRN